MDSPEEIDMTEICGILGCDRRADYSTISFRVHPDHPEKRYPYHSRVCLECLHNCTTPAGITYLYLDDLGEAGD